MILAAQIDTLLKDCLSAWNARKFDDMATFFSQLCTFAFPGSAVATADRAALREHLRNFLLPLPNGGFSLTRIAAVTARRWSGNLVVGDARSVKRPWGDGSILKIIVAYFTKTKSRDTWIFVTALACTSGRQDT